MNRKPCQVRMAEDPQPSPNPKTLQQDSPSNVAARGAARTSSNLARQSGFIWFNSDVSNNLGAFEVLIQRFIRLQCSSFGPLCMISGSWFNGAFWQQCTLLCWLQQRSVFLADILGSRFSASAETSRHVRHRSLQPRPEPQGLNPMRCRPRAIPHCACLAYSAAALQCPSRCATHGCHQRS